MISKKSARNLLSDLLWYVEQALAEGINPKEILNDGLSILEPKLVEIGNEPVGKAVIDTVVEELNERGIRDKFIVMVGGAPVTDAFAQQIGADYYTADAATCAEVAKKAVEERK